MSSGFSSSDLAPKTPSSSPSSSNGTRSLPVAAPSKPEWLTKLFGWKGRLKIAGMFVGGITCGIIAMKMFGPKSADPQTAAAVSPSTPSGAPQNPETVIETDDGTVQIKKLAPQTPTNPGTGGGNTQDTTPTPAETPDTPEEAAAKRSGLLSTLLTLRSQIDSYKSQHGGRVPDLVKYPQWGQLTRRTASDGTPATDGQFGPYIMAAPANPVNGFTMVGVLKKIPAAGEVVKADGLGFVYSITTGELVATEKDGKTIFDDHAARAEAAGTGTGKSAKSGGTTSVTAKPRTSDQDPKQKAAVTNLRQLRGFVEQFRKQHDGKNPDFVRYDNWEQFTKRTAANGALAGATEKRAFGPYLASPPPNPLNGHTLVETVNKLHTYTPKGGRKIGYVFESSSGNIFATDTTGAIMRD